MAFKDTLKNLNHLFDWTALEVTEPMAYQKEYNDIGNFLLGYQVTVKYRYHGVYEYIPVKSMELATQVLIEIAKLVVK